MNKYIIPIYCDGDIWIESVSARSIADCQYKLMQRFSEDFDDDLISDYREFLNYMFKNYGYIIGDITDIETL